MERVGDLVHAHGGGGGGSSDEASRRESKSGTQETLTALEKILEVETVQLAPSTGGHTQTLDLFTGVTASEGNFTPRVYGGQLIAQALNAASKTLPPGRRCHSCHCYFMSPGDTKERFVFTVERLRDGKSFCQRQVVARQRGAAVFTMMASYQSADSWDAPTALQHQKACPEGVPPPESLPTQREFFDKLLEDDRLSEEIRASVRRKFEALPPFPLDIRFVSKAIDRYFPTSPREPRQLAWVRMPPGDAPVHESVVAYASDWGLLETVALPHGVNLAHRRLRMASLDHSIYFHHPIAADEWLLFEMESTSASGERGLAHGYFYGRDGTLRCSVTQEGLVRVVNKPSTGRRAKL